MSVPFALTRVWVVVGLAVLGCGGKSGPSGAGSAGAGAGSAGADGLGTGGTAGPTGAAGTTGAGTAGSGGTAAGGTSGGTTGAAGSGARPSDLPMIVSFKASPAYLPKGGGSSMLSWQVTNADSVSIAPGVGAVTGTSATVNVTASQIYTLTATNSHGKVTAVTAVGVGQNPASDSIGREVDMVSPTNGETFIAPATLRLIASAEDPNVFINSPTEGHGGNAASVQFFVDDAMVLTVDGTKAEYYVFKGFTTGVAAGQHRVWARAIYTAPTEQLDSTPQLITVEAAPTYAKTVDLTADVVVPSQGYSLVGSASARVRLNGHGYSIKTSGSISGQVTLQFVDVFDLGNATDTSKPAVAVTTTGGLTIEDCNFDTSNTVSAQLDGAATASIRRNTFRSNMRMPLGQQPYPPDSSPALSFTGSSSGAKVFAGNNLAAGWFEIDSAKGWVLGGDTDGDSNVLIGARVGLTVSKSSNVQVRRNFSHHVYFGGWSQGANFELFGSPAATVEHNVVYGSSWPVRGVGCEFRYNLVLDAGHEWLWPESTGSIHHNIFYGGENDVGGIFVRDSYTGIKFFNNTLDGGQGWMYAVELQAGSVALTSNAFVNVPKGTTVHATGATLTADYNFFDNAQANYWDSRHPAHDVGGQAMLTMPPTTSFDLDESAVWRRGTTVSGVLALYRTRYTPKAGSPLIDAGDPAGGAGNDIGAVGAGTPNAADKFGQP